MAVRALELLGWEVKMPEGAEPVFRDEFGALGVLFGMPGDGQKELIVKDKPERAVKIAKVIEKAEEDGFFSALLAMSLRSLVNYSRAQCFGRCGAPGLHFLSSVVRSGGRRYDPYVAEQLAFWPRYFAQAKPRTVRFTDPRGPVVVLTDGADEEAGVGVAAVMVDPYRRAGGKRFFAGRVADEVVEEWRCTGGKRKVIHQAELLPAAVALETWAEIVAGRRLLVLIDSDSARAALTSGTTGNLASAGLVHRFWAKAAELGCYPWIGRVPTRSNVADAPSRGDFAWLRSQGFLRDAVAEFDGDPPQSHADPERRGEEKGGMSPRL